MNTNWNTTLWGLVLRVIWLAIAVAGFVAVLRLCAWADTGIRNESPIEKNIIPTN